MMIGSRARAMAMPRRKRMPWNRAVFNFRPSRGCASASPALVSSATGDQDRAPASLSASPRIERMASPAALPSRP
jgi:hypothetical protein